ncbi:dual specificity mitogen-activated protein kinase kinase 5-like [Xenia sp. Carnegie-2017]|uniref:dual specificity mitogen-activated protein kinase kinase 5-like n=1 Tax=Xenia sp. Carnegie-2017 TaxID=2897299 RepID=UPI001F03873A|nr:dual specificity mitogen-activated protein kinase kinase 5-like [Xenia sp. Carnegie-2017]
MASSDRFLLRLISNRGESTDWPVHCQITFREILEIISNVLPGVTTTAFEYEDEDGDRITVRSDEELKAMIDYHMLNTDSLIKPVQIYPKACRTPRKRNLHGLKVNTKALPVAITELKPKSSKNMYDKISAPPGSLRTILASGQVSHEELQYIEILGHGIGGTVYKCYHTASEKIMAVKVIQLDLTPEVQKQILLELNILFKCESPYIIGFFGAFFLENLISICTEFMDGGSLEIYGAIPEPVLGRISVTVVKGLVYLWQLKIMHRDVKPSNILVNTRGQIKLCDFGVSTQLVNSIATTYVGTNAYMAPERVLGGEYSVRSDVWSLGISVLEMALGRFPYCRENSDSKVFLPIELMQCIVNESPPSLPVEKFSPDFVSFVGTCMQKSIKSRPTPQELMDHPFIVLNNDENVEIVSMWVCRKLEEIRGRSVNVDSPNQCEPMVH